MSAESPKQTQEGCLPKFIVRFFIPQPPTGLEDFATRLQQGLNNHQASQRQQEIESRRVVYANIAAEEAQKIKTAQKQRELELKSSVAKAEAREILDGFQVEERLRYIQRTVWKGKGKIRDIGPEFGRCTTYGTSDPRDRLGGLELVYQYPFFKLNERTVEHSEGSYDEWQYVPKTSSTSLSIVILKQADLKDGERVLNFQSAGEIGKRKEGTYVHDPHYYSYDFCWDDGIPYDRSSVHSLPNVVIPIGTPESKDLLDLALTQEANYRLSNGFLPSQLEEKARKILVDVKQSPCWLRWTSNRNDL